MCWKYAWNLVLDRELFSQHFFFKLEWRLESRTGFYFGIPYEKVALYKLRQIPTILPPALPDSVGIEKFYGRYQGARRFWAKANSISLYLSIMQCFCFFPEKSKPLSNDHNSFRYRPWYSILVLLCIKDTHHIWCPSTKFLSKSKLRQYEQGV